VRLFPTPPCDRGLNDVYRPPGCRVASFAGWQIGRSRLCTLVRSVPALLGERPERERMRPAEPRKPGRGSLGHSWPRVRFR